jgi:hypothetical protein
MGPLAVTAGLSWKGGAYLLWGGRGATTNTSVGGGDYLALKTAASQLAS